MPSLNYAKHLSPLSKRYYEGATIQPFIMAVDNK
jgi:hypothetical protein